MYVSAISLEPETDANPIGSATRAVYVGNGGDLRCRFEGQENPFTFQNVPSGTVLPVRIIQVYSTGTTASNVIGLY